MATEISLDTVKHIARLARLQLTPEEESRYQKDLSSILGYMEILGEIDTENVSETAQVTGLTNVAFADKVAAAPCSGDELLKCTENEVRDRQVVVKKVF